MNINKKLDRVKQWAGEKMGSEAKTGVSDEFKTLELEMTLRYEGMEKLHKSTTTYVKSLSKRNEVEDKEKVLPVAYLAQTMIRHAEDFEPESTFGKCLLNMGRANDRVSRFQESYTASTTNSWLESLERSLTMLREYQSARKKLESRRLAYDASLSKIQKAKKEDFRAEEELRSQKAKYEESSDDVYRRMQDIKDAEADSIADLEAFLDAELEYHDKCRNELMRLKRDWPTGAPSPATTNRRPTGRSRSNTARSYNGIENSYSFADSEMEPPLPIRPSADSQIRHVSTSRLNSRNDTYDGHYESDLLHRPTVRRSSTFNPTSAAPRDLTPSYRKSSIPTDVEAARANLRPTSRVNTEIDFFNDPSDASTMSSPAESYRERSVSPATSHESDYHRPSANSALKPSANTSNRKAPPPPPPSRNKKPAPPPPPIKRADIGTNSVHRY